MFPSEADWAFKKYDGAGIGADVLPALAGVGYICGPVIASYMMAGAITAWFIMMPVIKAFGGDMIMFPSSDPIRIKDATGKWKFRKVPTVDWNIRGNAEAWRHAWEVTQNKYLEAAGIDARICMMSYERQRKKKERIEDVQKVIQNT